MRRIAKSITLKEDTLRDIESGNLDTGLFIDRINGYTAKANYLINTKMDKMSDLELLGSLEEVFDISFDVKDFLRMLSLKYGKHYLHFKIIATDMYDENDNNISYLGAVSSKYTALDGVALDFNTLRRLTNSGDVLLVQKIMTKAMSPIRKREAYVGLYVDEIDINSGKVDRHSDLYPFAATVVKKATITKYVLFDLKQYIAEVTHQAKDIMALSKSEDEELASIGKEFKSAYEKNANNGSLVKGEKVSVKYHKKSNKKRRDH